MSTEITTATVAVGEVLKNASVVTKLKDVANAHPIAAAVVGVGVLGLATWGTYKLLSGFIGRSQPEKVILVQAPAPSAPATPAAGV
jgi:predicted DNA-binding protein with PD1-like motif